MHRMCVAVLFMKKPRIDKEAACVKGCCHLELHDVWELLPQCVQQFKIKHGKFYPLFLDKEPCIKDG